MRNGLDIIDELKTQFGWTLLAKNFLHVPEDGAPEGKLVFPDTKDEESALVYLETWLVEDKDGNPVEQPTQEFIDAIKDAPVIDLGTAPDGGVDLIEEILNTNLTTKLFLYATTNSGIAIWSNSFYSALAQYLADPRPVFQALMIGNWKQLKRYVGNQRIVGKINLEKEDLEQWNELVKKRNLHTIEKGVFLVK